jgi:hypothetical protein
MTERSLEYDSEVSTSIAQVLKIANRVITEARWELQHLTFSLFIAGYAATDIDQKATAINLMSKLEPNSLGTNTAAVRQSLQEICHKQQANMDTTGYDLSVDWVTHLRATGRGLIMFGL